MIKIPPGYHLSNIGGVLEMVPDAGPRFRNGLPMHPRVRQPQAQPAAPVQRRQPTLEERLARSPLTPEAKLEFIRTIEDPKTWLPPEVYEEWRANGWIRE
jgi:hypothetical protein